MNIRNLLQRFLHRGGVSGVTHSPLLKNVAHHFPDLFFKCLFRVRVSLCSPEWPRTQETHLPETPQFLGLKACTPTLGYIHFLKDLFIFVLWFFLHVCLCTTFVCTAQADCKLTILHQLPKCWNTAIHHHSIRPPESFLQAGRQLPLPQAWLLVNVKSRVPPYW